MADIGFLKDVNRVVAKLQSKLAKVTKDKDVSVRVGYSTSYALFVHENLAAFHPVGQAKYLEAPARRFAKEIGEIVRTVYARTKNIAMALYTGGLKLQRESQLLVPVDTGLLKNSASTTLRRGT